MSMDAVREWLNKNKVFFEVFSACVFGMMGLVVSWSAARVAQYQAVIAETEVTPQLRADVEFERDPDTRMVTDDVLRVYNDGYRVRDVTMHAVTFLEVQATGVGDERPRYLWITYYGSSFHTGGSTGLLSTFRGFQNNTEAARIERETREGGPPGSSVRVEVVRVVFASYTDAMGKLQEETILVSPLGGSRRLSAEEGATWRISMTRRDIQAHHVNSTPSRAASCDCSMRACV